MTYDYENVKEIRASIIERLIVLHMSRYRPQGHELRVDERERMLNLYQLLSTEKLLDELMVMVARNARSTPPPLVA